MGYISDSLRGYKGAILWYHHGIMKCPIHHFWNDNSMDKNVSPINLRNLFHNMNIKKEQIAVWTHAPNTRAFLKYNKNYAGLRLYQTPIGYDPEIEPLQKPVEDAEFDFMYIGANKENRLRKLTSFLVDIPYSICILGKGFPDKTIKNVTFKSQRKGHGRVYELYRNAKASFIVGNPEFEQTGNQTTRFTQPVISGCLNFGDKNIFGIGSAIGASQAVGNKLALVNRYEKINANDERQQLVLKQQKNLQKWTTILQDLLTRIAA